MYAKPFVCPYCRARWYYRRHNYRGMIRAQQRYLNHRSLCERRVRLIDEGWIDPDRPLREQLMIVRGSVADMRQLEINRQRRNNTLRSQDYES